MVAKLGLSVGAVLVLLFAGAMAVAQTAEVETLSPCLQRLGADAVRDPRAVGQFWREVESAGAPLVEAIPPDDSNVLVTFLWRSQVNRPDAVVFASVLPANDSGRQRLARLEGTDIWCRTYRFPADLPVFYEISPRGPQHLQKDPQNSQILEGAIGGSIVLLPRVRSRQWSELGNAAKGSLDRIEIPNDQSEAHRSATVYLPASLVPGGDYDTIVVLDEDIYSGPVPMATILDNMIAAGWIRPAVAVLLANRDRAKDLSCSAQFSAFLAQRVLPFVESKFAFRRSRARTTVLGSILGGLAAACAGVHIPDQIGNVVSISASFRWRPPAESEPEWLARHIASAPSVPVRYIIDVGRHETGTPSEPGNPSLLTVSRHLRDMLRAKGYAVSYREFPGAHEPLSWRLALPDLLELLQ